MKLLGITINRNFRFTKHTNLTVSKVNYRLAHIAKLLSDRHLKMVTSVLQWGLELAGKDKTNLKKLQKCQNSILRLLTDSDKRMSIRLMLQRTNMLNVQNMTRLNTMVLVRRAILEGQCPKTMKFVKMPSENSRLKRIDDRLARDTRHADNAQLVVGIKLLNQMHWYRDKGKKESAKTFKKKAKEFLLANFDNQNIK